LSGQSSHRPCHIIGEIARARTNQHALSFDQRKMPVLWSICGLCGWALRDVIFAWWVIRAARRFAAAAQLPA
jgi:hypothetical protein